MLSPSIGVNQPLMFRDELVELRSADGLFASKAAGIHLRDDHLDPVRHQKPATTIPKITPR
jgi:hypothetical protein